MNTATRQALRALATPSVNASNTMVRRASELDTGSRIIVGGAIRTVVRVHDHYRDGQYVSVCLVLDNGGAIIESLGTLYTCAAS